MHLPYTLWRGRSPQDHAGPSVFVMSEDLVVVATLPPVEQHQILIDEIQAIRTKRGSRAKLERIMEYHDIGQAVIGSPLYAKHQKGMGPFVASVANDVGLGIRTIYSAIQFAHASDAAGGIEAWLAQQSKLGKNLTWGQTQKLMPRRSTDEEEDVEKAANRTPVLERADRASAARYAKRRVGLLWSELDQAELARLLAVKV